MDMRDIDPEDYEQVASRFGMTEALARELMYLNDEWGSRWETKEERFVRMRAWVVKQIKESD